MTKQHCQIGSLFVLGAFIWLFAGATAFAEPWISNRYAQNCAACHAPGRLNVTASERRCTLSCKGCHVNPNGAGLRSLYGKWNQQRWLKSGHLGFLDFNKHIPAPYKDQPYYQSKAKLNKGDRGNNKVKGKVRNIKNERDYSPEKMASIQKRIVEDGAPLRVAHDYSPNEELYGPNSYDEWKITASSREEWLSLIPEGDPYREERTQSVQGGGDLRYLFGTISGTKNGGEIPKERENIRFLMNVDIGVRIKPVKEKLSFVVEAQFQNQPTQHDIESGFSSAQGKSAYMLVDDLAFNTYVMAGVYRPMFGHPNIDHNSIREKLTLIQDFSKDAAYKAVGFGGSPNVPFFNVNYLMAHGNENNHQEEGLVASFGGRFVTLGLSLTASFWSTEQKQGGVITDPEKKNMWAVASGASLRNFLIQERDLIINAELIDVARESTSLGKLSGVATNFDVKYRIWREVYLQANYGQANTGLDLRKGSAKEQGFGIKAFPFPGTQLELMSIHRESKQDDGAGEVQKDDHDLIQLLAHLFF